MTTIFLTVTDLELLASQAVKAILLALLLFGVGLNLLKAWKEIGTRTKIIRAVIAIALFTLAITVARRIQIEGSLLSSNEYTIGTTLGFCQVFAKGKGIEFEYEIAGKKYKNCNTYHPISIESIVVPDGKYYVRYSARFPEKGRIDFNKPIK
jgi:hypothetical protein